MRKRIVWLLISCLMTLSLIIASCGTTDEGDEKATTGENGQTSSPVTKPSDIESGESSVVVPTIDEKPIYGGTYTTIAGDPMGFDEAYTLTFMCWTLRLTNEELVMGNWTKGPAGTGEYEWFTGNLGQLEAETGCLAESWEMPDDETIIFHLRQGVYFHNKPPVNGREMVADDVVFSINRSWTTPTAFLYASNPPEDRLISVRALDKYTVECKVPAHMQGSLFFVTSDQLKIIPPEMVEEKGDMRDWSSACGTGPYEITDYITSSLIKFEKFDNYWQEDPVHPGNQLPYLDSVRMLIINDSSTQMAAIRTGEVDASPQLVYTWDNLKSLLQSSPELNYVKSDGYHYALWGRMDKPELPFDDLRVRQAMNMAIDKQSIVDDYYEGHADLCAPLYPLSKAFEAFNTPFDELPEAAQELFTYNPEKSKELLTEAGYPNGFRTEIACGTADADFLAIIKEYLRAVNINLEITPLESSIFSGVMRGRTYNEMVYKEATSRGFPFKMTEVRIEHTDDVAFYENERVRAAYNEINKYVGKDDSKWVSLCHDIYPYIIEQAVGIWLPVAYNYRVWWPWVKGYHGEYNVGYDNTYAYLQYIWVDEAMKQSMGY